jgi:hypothetical protein
MTIAYASLHTGSPEWQTDREVSYEGYHRIAVEYGEDFGHTPLTVTFPIIQADSDDEIQYIAIGSAERGQGEIFMRVPTLPMQLKTAPERLTNKFWLNNGAAPEQVDNLILEHGQVAPHIVICHTAPVLLPEHLNPIARVAHQLITAGLMTAEDLHPKMYEAINDALHNAGVPVIPVLRQGSAKMTGKISEMHSLSGWGNA